MTESTNEQILTDLIECLRDQISELTLRLDEANALNKRLVQSLVTERLILDEVNADKIR